MPQLAVPWEVKFAPDEGATMEFEGYGAVFGNVDAYGDVIEPGAFAKTLSDARKSGRWPAMLSQHGGWGMGADGMTPVGVWTDMAEDGKGLRVTGRLAKTPRGLELYELMRMEPRPAIDGMSIGYVAKEFEVGTKPSEPRRRLKAIELMEVSLVTFPANPKARVASVKAGELTERELERLLVRDAGLTRTEAEALVRRGFDGLSAVRDAGGSERADALAAIRRLTQTIRT